MQKIVYNFALVCTSQSIHYEGEKTMSVQRYGLALAALFLAGCPSEEPGTPGISSPTDTAGCYGECGTATPTIDDTPTATECMVATSTAAATPSGTPSATPTATMAQPTTPTAPATSTMSPTPTPSASSTPTVETGTPYATPSMTPTELPTPTATPDPVTPAPTPDLPTVPPLSDYCEAFPPQSGGPSIQECIERVHDGGWVFASSGTYPESIDFLGKNILVEGSGVGYSILQGNENEHAVTFQSGETNDAVLYGMTIIDGIGRSGSALFIQGASPTLHTLRILYGSGVVGGSAVVTDAVPTFTNVVFEGSSARDGGAMYVENGSVVTLDNCEFYENMADESGGAIFVKDSVIDMQFVEMDRNVSEDYGGAVVLEDSDATIRNSAFLEGESYSGAGIAILESSIDMNDVLFAQNTAEFNGGGIYMFLTIDATLTDVDAWGNRAEFGGGIHIRDSSPVITRAMITENIVDTSGGGIYSAWSLPVIRNTVIATNISHYEGGGIEIVDSREYNGQRTLLEHVTIAQNIADWYSGGILIAESDVTMRNSIVSGNTLWLNELGGSHNGQFIDSTEVELYYTMWWNFSYDDPGISPWDYVLSETNMVDDPLFLSPGEIQYYDPDQEDEYILFYSGEYQLHLTSPARDAGGPAESCLDPNSSRCDMGAYGGPDSSGW